MVDKKYVLVKCVAKEVFDDGLKPGLVKEMTKYACHAIDKKSKDKLTTKKKSKTGFLLSVLLIIKADKKDAPTKMAAKITFSVVTMGSTTKAFNGSSGGSIDGFGSQAEGAAQDLISSIFDSMMPKVIKAMLKL